MKKINLLFILLLLITTISCDSYSGVGDNEVVVAKGEKIKATTIFNPTSDNFTGYKYWYFVNMFEVKKDGSGRVIFADDYVFRTDVIAGKLDEVFSFEKKTETTGVITIFNRNTNRNPMYVCKLEIPYAIEGKSKILRFDGMNNYPVVGYRDDVFELISIDKDRIIYDYKESNGVIKRIIVKGTNTLKDRFYDGYEKYIVNYDDYCKILQPWLQ